MFYLLVFLTKMLHHVGLMVPGVEVTSVRPPDAQSTPRPIGLLGDPWVLRSTLRQNHHTRAGWTERIGDVGILREEAASFLLISRKAMRRGGAYLLT